MGYNVYGVILNVTIILPIFTNSHHPSFDPGNISDEAGSLYPNDYRNLPTQGQKQDWASIRQFNLCPGFENVKCHTSNSISACLLFAINVTYLQRKPGSAQTMYKPITFLSVLYGSSTQKMHHTYETFPKLFTALMRSNSLVPSATFLTCITFDGCVSWFSRLRLKSPALPSDSHERLDIVLGQ